MVRGNSEEKLGELRRVMQSAAQNSKLPSHFLEVISLELSHIRNVESDADSIRELALGAFRAIGDSQEWDDTDPVMGALSDLYYSLPDGD